VLSIVRLTFVVSQSPILGPSAISAARGAAVEDVWATAVPIGSSVAAFARTTASRRLRAIG
jgi:hypothetical protein